MKVGGSSVAIALVLYLLFCFLMMMRWKGDLEKAYS